MNKQVYFIYRYLTHPFQTILEYDDYRPKREFFSVVALVSIAEATQLNVYNIRGLILFSLLFFVFISFFLFIQSVVTDFIAQWLKLQPQSLKLFYWFGLTLLPNVLLVPKGVFSFLGIGFFSGLSGFLALFITAFVIVLQVFTIKTLYKTSTSKGALIYLAPVLSLCFLVFVCVMMGVLIAVFFLR